MMGMGRVVAQSALLTTHGHGHGPSKENENQKRSVKMAYGLQAPPLLRKRSGSIYLDNKMVRFGPPCVVSKFEGFTEEAIEAIMLAREESRRLGEDYIEGEHILLGILGKGTGIVAKALKSMGNKLKHVRKHVIREIDKFRDSDRGCAALGFGFEPFTVDVLVRSFEEARRLGHNYIGPGHLLIGLLLEGNDGAPVKRALRDQGVDLSSIYRQVVRMVGEGNKVNGATTLGEYSEHIEKDQAIKCPEASAEETILTLMDLKEHYEIHHKLKSYTIGALYAAAELSDQYISDRFLPDKAIGLFDKAGARVSTRHAELLEIVRELTRELRQIIKSKKEADRSLDLKKFVELHDREMELKFLIYVFHKMNRADKIVKKVDIRGVISSWTGIPIEKLVIDESDRLRKMEETLRKRVIGQDEAVKAVSYYAYHGLWRLLSEYTLLSFIFYGPTGVGKSELTKALAAYYFGSEEAVIQLDTREFMESRTASKLIGSSPEGGQLTEAVRRRPHSIVLLKGIEKAHADVLNMIRQILREGWQTGKEELWISGLPF